MVWIRQDIFAIRRTGYAAVILCDKPVSDLQAPLPIMSSLLRLWILQLHWADVFQQQAAGIGKVAPKQYNTYCST